MWVVGLARDCGHTLEQNIEELKSLTSGYDVHWAILESNSTDSTPEILSRFVLQEENFALLQEPKNLGDNLSRTEKMALRRNEVSLYCAERTRNLDIEVFCTIVVDLDNPLCLDAHIGEFQDELENGIALFAHQRPNYYDIWALRDGRVLDDCFQLIEQRIKSGNNPFRVYKEELLDQQRRLGRVKDRIEVFSAFGGLAIYPQVPFYDNCYQGDVYCEHVPFNKGLHEKGMRLFIEPRLQTEQVKEHTRYSRGVAYFLFAFLSKLPRKISFGLFKIASKIKVFFS